MNKTYVFADRMEYSVFVLDIPPMRKKRRESAAKIMLHSKYPLSLVGKRIILLQNGKQKNSCICFVCPDNYVDENRVSSTLYVLNRLQKYSGNACFVGKNFIEKLEIKDGSLVSSHASILDGEEFKSDESCKLIKQVNAKRIENEDLFPATGYGQFLKKIVIAAIIFITVGIIGVNIAGRYTKQARTENERKRLLDEAQKEKAIKMAALKKQAEALRADYQALLYSQNPSPYMILTGLRLCLLNQTCP